MAHLVRHPFILNGVEFHRGDLISKTIYKQLEKEQSLFLSFIIPIADEPVAELESESQIPAPSNPKKAQVTKKLSDS